MLVCFERIQKLFPNDVKSKVPTLANGATPVGDLVTAGPDRVTVYDPVWGYFTFGQEVVFEYQDTRTYVSYGQFEITGTFSIRAETSSRDPAISDESAFTILTGKYEQLNKMFTDAALAEDPLDFTDWATVDDPRCVVLPLPLVDKNGDRIYARPESISMLPGRWPAELKYRAVLREQNNQAAKVMVNGYVVDGAVITLTLPQPMISRHRMPGSVGEIIQVRNYAAMEIEVAGSMPIAPGSGESIWANPSGLNPTGHVMRQRARDMINAIRNDVGTVEVVRISASGIQSVAAFQNWERTDPTNVEVALERRVARLQIKFKE